MNSQLVKPRHRMLHTAIASALALAGAAFSVSSQAATDFTDLAVGATVAANCTIATSEVAFGAYDPVSANASTALDSTGTVTVACTSGAGATITLGQGANADAASTDAVPLRRMLAGASDYLSYSLFSESGRTSVWGNTPETDVAHTGTGAAVGITVYGRVNGGQNVPAGTYADTVVATVTF